MPPSPPPPASPARAYRRGFWRLALLAWLAGAALLLWLPDEPLLSPLANVCTTDDAYDYVECRLDPSAEPGMLERMTDYLAAEPTVDVARVVPRWTTVRHRETLKDVPVEGIGTIPLFNLSAHFEKTPGAITAPPPRLSAHTDEVLAEAGVSDAELGALRAKGVV